jgi:hypothetical protein
LPSLTRRSASCSLRTICSGVAKSLPDSSPAPARCPDRHISWIPSRGVGHPNDAHREAATFPPSYGCIAEPVMDASPNLQSRAVLRSRSGCQQLRWAARRAGQGLVSDAGLLPECQTGRAMISMSDHFSLSGSANRIAVEASCRIPLLRWGKYRILITSKSCRCKSWVIVFSQNQQV